LKAVHRTRACRQIKVDVRSLIVFLCEEANNGSSFRLSTKAWEEIVDVLWVDSIGIPVSLVGRFNAILDINQLPQQGVSKMAQ